MKKYPKEFIILLSDWLRGSITDKNLFEKYDNIINLELTKNDYRFRIWDLETKEINNIIKNGILNIDKHYFESSFYNKDDINLNNFSNVEKIIEKLTPYISDYKIITKRKGNFYNPYNRLEYCLNNKKMLSNFSDNEKDLIEKRLENYKYQQELFLIKPNDVIRLMEIQYVLISDEVIKKMWIENSNKMKENDKILSNFDFRIKNYFCYNIETFILITKKIPLLTNNKGLNFCYPELEL